MTEPAAHIPHDQAPTGADGMIVCDRLVRIYSGEGIEVQALQGLDLLIAEGELTALIGAAAAASPRWSTSSPGWTHRRRGRRGWLAATWAR